MTKLCICEICNCGRHRCAHKPTAIYDKGNASACVLTEYVDKYPGYGIYNPPQSMKPKQDLDHARNKGPMDGVTTFKRDYIPHEITRHPLRQQTEYKPNSAKIDLETTYNQTYNPHDIQPFAPVRPRQRSSGMKGKLDTIPTYKDDFRQWETCRREMNKPDNTYQPPSDKFGGTTTFQDDFIPRSVAPRESFKPSNIAKPSEVPFDGVTSNQLSFIPHPIESRYIRPPDMYKPSSEPLLDLTTHRQDFQGLRGELTQSCKPCPNKYSVNTPFQGSTENRDKFKVWPVSLPQLRKTDEYVGPMEHMDLSTTTAADYVRHQIQPFISARPYLTPKRSSAPFQSCTTMREDFQPWLGHARQPLAKMHEEMHKASGKMEDLTTFRAHYTPHELRPSISCKPTNQPMRASVPMEGFTMYRTAFTPKRITVCPASYESPPGYVFQEADERGHKYFRKLSSKDSKQNHVDSVVPMQKEVAVL